MNACEWSRSVTRCPSCVLWTGSCGRQKTVLAGLLGCSHVGDGYLQAEQRDCVLMAVVDIFSVEEWIKGAINCHRWSTVCRRTSIWKGMTWSNPPLGKSVTVNTPHIYVHVYMHVRTMYIHAYIQKYANDFASPGPWMQRLRVSVDTTRCGLTVTTAPRCNYRNAMTAPALSSSPQQQHWQPAATQNHITRQSQQTSTCFRKQCAGYQCCVIEAVIESNILLYNVSSCWDRLRRGAPFLWGCALDNTKEGTMDQNYARRRNTDCKPG